MVHRLLLMGTVALAAERPGGRERDEEAAKATPTIQIVIPTETGLTAEELQDLAAGVARVALRADPATNTAPVLEDQAYVTGHEYLWLDPRDAWIAEAIETTAREVALGLLELGAAGGDLEMTDRGATVVFKVDQGESVRLIVLERTPDGLVTVMAGRHWEATAHTDARIEMQVVNGEVNLAQAKREAAETTTFVTDGAGASTADCAGDGSAVCCSFQAGTKVRIVCMCRQNGQAGPAFVWCGDTGWM